MRYHKRHILLLSFSAPVARDTGAVPEAVVAGREPADLVPYQSDKHGQHWQQSHGQ